MKKPLINFKTARIIEIVSIVLMLILSGLTALLELSKAFLAVSIVGGLTVYVVTALLFDRCPCCGRPCPSRRSNWSRRRLQGL